MERGRTCRRLAAAILALLMVSCSLSYALAEGGRDQLQAALAREAVDFVKRGDSDYNLYKNMLWPDAFTALPDSFDLRDLGVVPPIRNQGSWGTCWGFASIAACESSILTKLGLSAEAFKAKYGEELNLSEKHLAWFGTGHLPALADYPQGQYCYKGLEGQAGEGMYQRDAQQGQAARYNNGGVMAYASGIFASGIGPELESAFPYAAADGTASTASDWTLGDDMRFHMFFPLEDSALLPSPAQSDAQGNYVFSEAGVQAIKSELLNGRAVAFAYHADQAMDPDAQKNMLRDQLVAMGLAPTQKQIDLFYDVRNGTADLGKASREDALFYMRVVIAASGIDVTGLSDDDISEMTVEMAKAAETPAEAPDAQAADAENAEAEARARAQAEAMGIDYDEYSSVRRRKADADDQVYINTEHYAQYTFNQDASATHAVTIIGWDDHYPASNFLEGHQPPADGAWIVRNSWGDNYGNDGYFYLSYYDQSICAPESFDFEVSDIDSHPLSCDIMGHDFMQAGSVSSVQLREHAKTANIFQVESDSVLSYVSVLTADLNTRVTVCVYLLNEDAASPEDGTMLDSVTASLQYGGYHRIALKYNYAVPAGSRISVVQTQRTDTTEGMVYAVPYTVGLNEKYMQAQNIFELDDGRQITNWVEGRINRGESFVFIDGAWADWVEVIAELNAASEAAAYLSYDNLNIKLYAYPQDQVEALHQLDAPVAFNGARAQVCGDCGYTIIQQ